MNIDYSRLSPIDFENLVRDIFDTVNKNLIPSETFSVGKDGGIDVRKVSKSKKIIIQAKHYKDWDNLWTALKDEKEKVNTIKPDRYILATSYDLSKSNVDKINELFEPYIKSTDDIWGKNRLNDFLEKNGGILERHMKLWLDSSTILNAIINSGNIEKNKTLKNDIENKIKHYVKNESFKKTIKILNESNYCIISGIPGIGKTTLAEMISYFYMNKGYRLFKITNDIEEAYKFLGTDEEKVLFYYDDFLGSNFLEYGLQTKNEDSNIIDFIKTINRNHNKNKKIIFTTREYILNQAFQKYNKFNEAGLVNYKFIVDIKQYSLKDKMKILFNHLYFSSLSHGIKYEIVKDKLYNLLFLKNKRKNQKGTIFEERFNPKILSLLLLDERIKKEKYKNGRDFIDKLNSILSNKNELYEDVFVNKISESSQNMLLILFSYGGYTKIESLKNIWKKYQKSKNQAISEKDWILSLKELEGTFTITNNKGSIIEFIDPFINDFFIYYINNKLDIFQELLSISEKWDQIEYLTKAFLSNKILIENSATLNIIKDKYLELETDKSKKLLFLYTYLMSLGNFILSEIIYLLNSSERYDLNYMLVLLMHFKDNETINHKEFIENYIDCFEYNSDINDLELLSKHTNLNEIGKYFDKYGYSTEEMENNINEKNENNYKIAEEIKEFIDNNKDDFIEKYDKSCLDQELSDSEVLGNFIQDKTVYRFIEKVIGEIEGYYYDLEHNDYDDYDDYREQINNSDDFEYLFCKLT